MDRRIEPEVPLHHRRAGVGPGVHRRAPGQRRAGRRVPRVRAAEGRDPHRRDRAGPHRGRVADHRAPRAVAQRGAGSRRSARSRRAALPDRAAVRGGHRPAGGPPARPGAHRHDQPDPADLGPAACCQPMSATSQVLKIGLSSSDGPGHDGPVHDRLLEDPCAPAPGPGRGQRPDLGRAAGHGPGAGRPEAHGAGERHPRAGDDRDLGRPGRRAADVLQGHFIGRGGGSTARNSGRASGTCSRS